jgi:transcriptional regulator of acetoin/glycerol metabolism
MAALEGAAWPFNVRELESTMLRLLVDAEGARVLTLGLCTDDLAYLAAPARQQRRPLSLESVRTAVAETGSISAAARSLGVHRATLYRQFPAIVADAPPQK